MADLATFATYGEFIERRAQESPDAVFATFIRKDGITESLTFGDLERGTAVGARAFLDSGAVSGDRVLVFAPNSLEMLTTILACARAGLVSVPVNTANIAEDVAYLLDLVEPVVIVIGSRYRDVFDNPVIATGLAKLAVVIGESGPLHCASTTEQWSEFVARGERLVDVTFCAPGGDDLFQLLPTSGTTGRSKAVMHSHATRLRSAYRTIFHSRLRSDDVVLNPFPMFHINCLDSAIFPALVSGCRVVLFEAFSASTFWKTVQAEQATVVCVMPTVIRAVTARPGSPEDREHSVRLVLGALRPSWREIADFLERFGLPRYETGYGLTEAGMAVTQTLSELDLHYPSIGLPMFDRTVDLFDEQGRPVAAGASGEIVVKAEPASGVMTGYWRDPDATANALRGGWLHTGDLARADSDGYLYFVGRLKDVIKRSGENIGAEEVEAVLVEAPGVEDAAVIGVPDAYRDEAVMACIVVRPGEPDVTLSSIVAFCRGRLADFKIPTALTIVDELPRGLLGKVDKKALRAMYSGHEPESGKANRDV